MVFLPGDHVLDTNITVANIIRLKMHGVFSYRNTATIVCSGSVGLSFTSMVDLKIDYLALPYAAGDMLLFYLVLL